MSIVALTAVLLSGCAAFTTRADDAGVPDDEEFLVDELPEAAPAFAAHFTDPIYDDPATEFAPFGSDEGWDMLHEWDERRDELTPQTTVADLIEGSGFADLVSEAGFDFSDDIPEPGGLEDAATIVVGAGFTLLRLTGRSTPKGAARRCGRSISSSSAMTRRPSWCASATTCSRGRASAGAVASWLTS